MNKKAQKGFTLIELLVVIAIIAVLSVVVILTLNPAELLRQARDSSRISDLNTLKSAIALFLADLNSTSSAALGTGQTCYESTTAVNATNAAGCAASWFGVGGATVTSTSATAGAVNGTGWIPIDFSQISSGAPIGNLPSDPTNDPNFLYAYTPTSTFQYELGTNMESTKYVNGGGDDVESTDGGDKDDFYETGSSVRL